jgi:hypothetical protein
MTDEDELGVSTHVITKTKLRLGTLAGVKDAWRFEALPEGALALVRCISDPQAAQLRAARVGKDGLLYEIVDPQEKVSRTSDILMSLVAPQQYRVWWTLDEDLYAEMLDTPQRVLEEGVLIRVEQYRWEAQAPLLSSLEEFDRDDGFHERADTRHVICHHILHRHVFYESKGAPIFDVTPACIRALCTVEFMEWYAQKVHEASANDMATFGHAAAMIEAAEKGLPDRALEKRAAELFPTPEERRVFDYFRDYTWRCVATGVRQDAFARSIRMDGPSPLPVGGVPEGATEPALDVPEWRWLEAADDIRKASEGKKHGPAIHPYRQGVTGPIRLLVPEGITLSPEQQQLLVDYYEAYMFGAALRTSSVGQSGFEAKHDYRARMKARLDELAGQADCVREQGREILETLAPPDLFFATVASCYPQSDDLLDRYVDAAAYCGSLWWGFLAQAEDAARPGPDEEGTFADGSWPFWKRFKARTKPLAEGTKAAGKVSKALAERAAAAYDLTIDEARKMLDTIGRLEVTLNGDDVDAAVHMIRGSHSAVRLDSGSNSSELTLSLQSARRQGGSAASVTLRFMRSAPVIHPKGVSDPPSGAIGARNHAWKATGFTVGGRVEVPADLTHIRKTAQYPPAFAALADTVNLAIAVATLAGEAKAKDRVLATFDLTKSVVGIVESFPGALAAMKPELKEQPLLKGIESKVKSLKGLSTWLGRFDGGIKIYKGLDILFSDESDVQYEASHGRTFRAEVQRFGGVASVVAGTATMVDTLGAAASAAGIAELLGCSTTLLAGFSATPWGLLFALGGSIVVAGSALVVDLTQPWTDRLMHVERTLDQAAAREMDGARFKASGRLEQLLRVVGESW